ncbi:MAG: L-fucose/L-arabinose isomerase family protein [Oscillospiraceae bacterium]
MKKLTFALYFGNRGFFPGELIDAARKDLRAACAAVGADTIEMDASLTRFGAVETMAEGRIYANFLEENRGKFDGVILSLPNFGDENGATVALQDAGVPILLQAYPDEFGLMDFNHRRDSFCGKLSIADVFRQNNIKFTVMEPHTCHPASKEFNRQLTTFAQTCAIVKKMRRFNVGAIGARTTAFKTIRYDEIAMAKVGINCETMDLTQFFAEMHAVDTTSAEFKDACTMIASTADYSQLPQEQMEAQARLYVAVRKLSKDYYLDALALRCWNEMQAEFKIAPCSIMGILGSEELPVACELDVCNAISMAILQAASGSSPICMDWNNNYGDDPDKCILFHCGSVPPDMMTDKGEVISHKMLDKGHDGHVAWGCNQGRVKPAPMTYLSAKTENGKLSFYMGEGEMTDDPIEAAFFGCAGVAHIPGLQRVLKGICTEGFRHHVSLTLAHVQDAVLEACGNYLGYDIVQL